MIIGDIAKNREANIPAVVLLIVLTSAKITIAVSELRTIGSNTVKSYRVEPIPKIW